MINAMKKTKLIDVKYYKYTSLFTWIQIAMIKINVIFFFMVLQFRTSIDRGERREKMFRQRMHKFQIQLSFFFKNW